MRRRSFSARGERQNCDSKSWINSYLTTLFLSLAKILKDSHVNLTIILDIESGTAVDTRRQRPKNDAYEVKTIFPHHKLIPQKEV